MSQHKTAIGVFLPEKCVDFGSKKCTKRNIWTFLAYSDRWQNNTSSGRTT